MPATIAADCAPGGGLLAGCGPAAGKGADVQAMRRLDPDLVNRDSWLLETALRQVVEALPEGGRVLVVAPSPTNEAAVFGRHGHAIRSGWAPARRTGWRAASATPPSLIN
jgi:hypothetical protein